MLQRLLDLRPTIECTSVHTALTGIVQGLLVSGCPAVDLVSSTDAGAAERSLFDRTVCILTQGQFLDPDPPIRELARRRRVVRIPNPFDSVKPIPPRLRLNQTTDAAAALLHAFLVLRVRYQTSVEEVPLVYVEAEIGDRHAVDTLYLLGDALTERYPVAAVLDRRSDRLALTLRGERALVTGGLGWARADYVRCRDASLIIRPLREALEGPDRTLIVPREVRGTLGVVRVRVAERAFSRIDRVRWLTSLQELREVGGDPLAAEGQHGEHYVVAPPTGGFLASFTREVTDAILPVRAITPQSVTQRIHQESSDGTISVVFESLGGAREIGANCYCYSFGHRTVVFDVGFDATRDGWLGLPALERLPRLDVLVLTHAHLDHVGALPVTAAAFPNTPIYCTRPTFAVLQPQLRDSAKIGGLRFDQTSEASCVSHGLVEQVGRERFRLVEYGARIEVPEVPGLVLEFHDAGHIIGSACVRMEFAGTSILHTGDISVEDQHLQKGMNLEGLSAAHVVMEGTYCQDQSFRREDRRAAVSSFLAAISERIDAGGSVLVPAFSLGRAQELVGLLVEWKEREKRSVPIVTVGLVNSLNEVSAAHAEFLPKMSGNPFAKVQAFPLQLRRNATEEQRRTEFARVFWQLANRQPTIVISSHGMMQEGTGSYLIGRAILTGDDPRHAIFLCGYMDPRTPGFRLRYQKNATIVDYGPGDPVERKLPSERIDFHRLTAHASYEELIEVATRTPLRSLTLIHGDGVGLDGMRDQIITRLQSVGKDVRVRAPAIGERFLLEGVRPPDGWDLEPTTAQVTSIGGQRYYQRETGFTLRGTSDEGTWVFIPVGGTVARLSLEHERIERGRIDKVEIRDSTTHQISVLFDRERGRGDLARLDWGGLGAFVIRVQAREASGTEVTARFPVSFGGELRPATVALDAVAPVLEFEVGGDSEPTPLALTIGGRQRPWTLTRWDPSARVLRIELDEASSVGSIEDLRVRVRWPNGFEQNHPAFNDFMLEPRVDLEALPVVVGKTGHLTLRSHPYPTNVRVRGQRASLVKRGISVTASSPGRHSIDLQFNARGNERVWREVGTLEVVAAAIVDVLSETTVGDELLIVVRGIAPDLYGAEAILEIGSVVHDRWTIGPSDRPFRLRVPDVEMLDVAIRAPTMHLVLWTGQVRVHSGLQIDRRVSVPIATADGKLEATLAWTGPDGWSSDKIDEALVGAGFGVRWEQRTAYVTGNITTLGMRELTVENARVRILTLATMDLSLSPREPYLPGAIASICISGDELVDGLESVDGGPLQIEADRVAPLYDGLSTEIVGNQVRFLQLGRYEVALTARGRRLAEVSLQVSSMPANIRRCTARSETAAASAYDVASAIEQWPAVASTVVHSTAPHTFRAIQTPPDDAVVVAWEFLTARLAAKEKVLVTWPGLTMSAIGGRLLRNLRKHCPLVAVARLPYPAPRGELASDSLHARRLRVQHRVQCCAPKSAEFVIDDELPCPNCEGRQSVRTDASRLSLECSQCSRRDQDITLTLAELRTTNVDVLFADYRLARYLTGTGARYAGGFGRSVRCAQCHRLQSAFSRPTPWNGAELRQLSAALASAWEEDHPTRSIRRAASMVAKRLLRPRPSDASRLEENLQRLVESGAIVNGRVVGSMSRLEAGQSLCCGKQLAWMERSVAHLFLDVEILFAPIDPAMHPGLVHGSGGVRQMAALTQ